MGIPYLVGVWRWQGRGRQKAGSDGFQETVEMQVEQWDVTPDLVSKSIINTCPQSQVEVGNKRRRQVEGRRGYLFLSEAHVDI